MLEGLLIGLGLWALLWGGVCIALAFASGWLAWGRSYACAERPLEGDVLAPLAVVMRPPIFFFPYALSVRVGASAHGFHLRTNRTLPVFHRSLRVPWSEVSVREHRWLFFDFAVFEFAGASGARLVLGSRTYSALRRKARLYWDPVDGPTVDPSLASGRATVADRAPGEGQETSPYTDEGSLLRLPLDGGTIGPARLDDSAVTLSGLPARLALAALAAVLFVGMLNLVGVFTTGTTDPDSVVASGADAELPEAGLDPGTAPSRSDPSDLAESDAACPDETFRIGDRFPDGDEVYCLHSEEAVRHGPFVAWHDNGVWKARGAYRMGKRDGTWIKYDPAGRVQVEAGFADDQKHGVLRVYDESGAVKSESTWDHGRRTG